MMEIHLLQEINIVDFKCFKNFQLGGFQRVNLISGKNNIGKTAFIEACFINTCAIDINALTNAIISIKIMRENINLLSTIFRQTIQTIELSTRYLEGIKRCYVSSNLRDVQFQVINEDGKKEYSFKIADMEKRINANEFSFSSFKVLNVNYIDNFGWSDEELIDAYQVIQRKDQEYNLDQLISDFDDTIESFKIIGEKPQCKFKGEYYDLVEFGDGLKHYISIICALYASENGYLFIDEIENGIHYTQLENIWKIIFKVSQKVNCQVFATTHSRECIEAYSARNENDEGAYFEFYRNQKTAQITASIRDREQLAYALSHNGRIRGE